MLRDGIEYAADLRDSGVEVFAAELRRFIADTAIIITCDGTEGTFEGHTAPAVCYLICAENREIVGVLGSWK